MNLEHNPSVDELREMVRECDDSAGHHLLWVRKNGDVAIALIPKDETPEEFESTHPEMQLRLEMFERGNEYVGPDAAGDEEWIHELFTNLENAWQKAKGKQEVASIDML